MNVETNEIILHQLDQANNFMSRLRGLMWKGPPREYRFDDPSL